MPIKYKFCAMADEYTANYGFNPSTPLTFTALRLDGLYQISLTILIQTCGAKSLMASLMINLDMS